MSRDGNIFEITTRTLIIIIIITKKKLSRERFDRKGKKGTRKNPNKTRKLITDVYREEMVKGLRLEVSRLKANGNKKKKKKKRPAGMGQSP